MLRHLGQNLRTLLWALVLALAVWVAAVTAADPDQVRTYPTPIKVEVVGQDPGLVINGDAPTEVQVTLRAPQSVWEQLTANPDSVRAVLDLSGLGAGTHKLNYQIQVDERPVRIVTVNPGSVTITLEPLITRTFQITSTVTGQLAIGYQAGDLSINPTTVVIAGPKSLVDQVDRAGVSVDLNGVRQDIDETAQVNVVDKNGAPITGLTVHPETVHLKMTVSQQGGFRDMSVKVVVRGEVASGYRLTSISVFPPVVTVYSSDPAVVNALPGVVETQPLDLQGTSDNINTRVSLNLPEGVSIVGQQTVLIQAGISPIQSSLTLSGEKVETVGLDSGLSADISPANVDVILSGPLPVLQSLTRQDVRVTVDAAGLTAGSYQLTPKVDILASNVTVESILPATVEVVIGSGPASTPTPMP